MDVVPSARVSVLPNLGDAQRIAAVPPPGAVRTELPAQATVQQTAAPSKPSNEKNGSEPESSPELSRRVTIDANTQELVLQRINEKSGEVVRQVPDQAMLRIRAYAREMRQAQADVTAEARVERVV
jgi:uncharacterized FlaG/YvyC family protein